MANEIIRDVLKNAGMYQWELAEMLGICEYTLCRKLRRELPDCDKENILTIIEQHGKAGKNDG